MEISRLCVVCGLSSPLLHFFMGCPYPSLLVFPIQPFLNCLPVKAPPLWLVFSFFFAFWLLTLVAIATEELSRFRQQCRARGCHQPTPNTAVPSPCLMTLFT